MSDRFQALQSWVADTCGLAPAQMRLEPASQDASFRQYFRLYLADDQTRVVMDAPPQQEDCGPFIRLAVVFARLGVHVPRIYAEDQAQGFLLLEDLGRQAYLDVLSDASADRLYGDALSTLMAIQACAEAPQGLPSYDRPLLTRELEIFDQWLLAGHLALDLSAQQVADRDAAYEVLIESALVQPQVLVHRDFHSRNLLLTATHSPGVIDFQDAVWGPVTYDLVSVLRDCYIDWPNERVEAWALGYFEAAVQSGLLRSEFEPDFMRWFDLMGMQRHLKAAGIFARLHRRDGKSGYLADIPRTLGYVVQVAARYPELSAFGDYIETRVLPAL